MEACSFFIKMRNAKCVVRNEGRGAQFIKRPNTPLYKMFHVKHANRIILVSHIEKESCYVR